jgi:sensor histidine kinase YesM
MQMHPIFTSKKALIFILTAFIIGLLAIFFIEDGGDAVYFAIVYQIKLAPLYALVIVTHIAITDTWFTKRKYAQYLVALITLIVVGAMLIRVISLWLYENSFTQDLFIGALSIISLLGATSILRYSFRKVDRALELQQYKADKMEAEIKLLKQQMNPHFLFNTLNSIYLKCLENEGEAAPMVLQLADLFRYQVETSQTETIPLDQEINFIDHFIFFERRRLTPSVDFSYEKDFDNMNAWVSPNLLITLAENAFKHALRTGNQSYIRISISKKDRILTMKTENLQSPSQNIRTGTGLNNLKKRLAHLYENRHEFTIERNQSIFTTTLKLTL